jgi:hypothetical protein
MTCKRQRRRRRPGFVYAGFAFFAVLTFWFVAAFLPEVKGLELEDKSKRTRVRRQPRVAHSTAS